MTEQEAISIADQFLQENALPAGAFIEARRVSAATLNDVYGYERHKQDFWVVDYWKLLPTDVLAETPGAVSVIVEEGSGRVFEGFEGWQ